MANYIYGAVGLTGGLTGALDEIDGADLAQDDAAIVFTSSATYIYNLDESSGGTESSPDLITPDVNAGNKRWILISTRAADSALDVSAFAGILDANDDDVQKALDTIDDMFSSSDFDITAGNVDLDDTVVKDITSNSGNVVPDTHVFSIKGETNSRIQTSASGSDLVIEFADLGIVTKTSSYTIVASDDTVIGDCAGGNVTLTLPDASTKSIIRIFKKSSSNVLTIDCYGSQTIESSSSITLSGEYDSAVFISDGTNTWVVGGGTASKATYA